MCTCMKFSNPSAECRQRVLGEAGDEKGVREGVLSGSRGAQAGLRRME